MVIILSILNSARNISASCGPVRSHQLYTGTKLNYWISGISTDLNILNLHSSVFNGGNVKPFISHHEMLMHGRMGRRFPDGGLLRYKK